VASCEGTGNRDKPIPAGLRPFPPGVSGNPNGRPKVGRSVSKAYAELLDTPGASIERQVAAYRQARGDSFCGSDSIAVGMLETAGAMGAKSQVAAAEAIADRTEGKVEQVHAVRVRELQDVAAQLEAETGIPAAEILSGAAKLGGGGV
jgi:hypothetical protein